ncbi:rRNA 2'-O-methyltransferase fibrillarin-like [Motacilla alba alba]|uniref:rRNA 2'-O-methyltransferase fibrillarin-like n=1 Tax=Motacilla alba alba TaxID=1094192 RepID=UPI0018D54C5E|nr:rRNA 2'-O-methyltransferase fibrillarin-like [Motacilla alba alba]
MSAGGGGDGRAGGGCGGRGAAPFPWCRGSGGRSGRDFIRVPQVPGRQGRAVAAGPGGHGSGRGVGVRRGEGRGGGTEPKGPYGRARGLGPASSPPLPRARFIVLIPLIDPFSPRSSPLSSRLTGRSGSAAPGSRRHQHPQLSGSYTAWKTVTFSGSDPRCLRPFFGNE